MTTLVKSNVNRNFSLSKSLSKSLRRIPRVLLFLCLVAVLVVFITFPKRYMGVCLSGITLWATRVLPATLPFLFLTGLISKLGFVRKLSLVFTPVTALLFALSGVSGYCVLTSFLCGYPVGAKTLADLKENGFLSGDESAKTSLVCSSSGPLFILGSVGMGMFSSAKVGVILLLSHFASIILVGVLFRFLKTPPAKKKLPVLQKIDNLLYECMYSSIITILCVGGFIALFYTLSQMLVDLQILTPLVSLLSLTGLPPSSATAFLQGLVEMTSGCALLSQSITPIHIALCAFLITFGGVSILMQQGVYLVKAGVNLKLFLPVKLLQSVLAFGICLGLCYAFPL